MDRSLGESKLSPKIRKGLGNHTACGDVEIRRCAAIDFRPAALPKLVINTGRHRTRNCS
jgi:hypothetical protein